MAATTGVVLVALEDSGPDAEDCTVEVVHGQPHGLPPGRPCTRSTGLLWVRFGIVALLGVAAGVALMAALWGPGPGPAPAPARTVCRVVAAGDGHWYPAPTNPQYYVDFNRSTRQPNYVAYDVPAAGDAAAPGSYWPAADPYGQDVLPPPCYNARGAPDGFRRGRLAPGAVFGPAANFMAAAVPVTPAFGQGAWRALTARLRGEFAGARVVVGCEYAGNRTVPAAALRGCRDVARPDGCYFLVLAAGGGLSPPGGGAVLASGYYAGRGDAVQEDRLPWWAVCG